MLEWCSNWTCWTKLDHSTLPSWYGMVIIITKVNTSKQDSGINLQILTSLWNVDIIQEQLVECHIVCCLSFQYYNLFPSVLTPAYDIFLAVPLLLNKIFPVKRQCLHHRHYEVCFRANNWQLQASPKVAKCGNFRTGKHSIFGNFKVLSVLANPITRCLMNAQHSISDSLMMLPKLATSVSYSQHIQIWQNLFSDFIVLPITFHCGFLFPFLEIQILDFCDTYSV